MDGRIEFSVLMTDYVFIIIIIIITIWISHFSAFSWETFTYSGI
jgi:hypothetical protein